MRRYVSLARALASAVLAGAVAAVAASAPAQAHTDLEHASPGPGEQVAPGVSVIALTFSGELAEGGRVTVTGPAEAPLPAGQPVRVDGDTLCMAVEPLAAGVHAVEYETVFGDGHPISGRYLFEVVAGGTVADGGGPCQGVALPAVGADPPPDPPAASGPGAGVIATAAVLTVLVTLLAFGVPLWRIRRAHAPRQRTR